MSNRPIEERVINGKLYARVGSTVSFRGYTESELTQMLLGARKHVEMLEDYIRESITNQLNQENNHED